MINYHQGEVWIDHSPMQSVPLGVAKVEFWGDLDDESADKVTISVPVRVVVFVDHAHNIGGEVIRRFDPEELQYSLICKDEVEEKYIRLKAIKAFTEYGLVSHKDPDDPDLMDRMYRLMTEPLSDDSVLKGPGAFAMTLNSVAQLLSAGTNQAVWTNPENGMPGLIKALEKRANDIRELLHEMGIIGESTDGEAAEEAQASDATPAG